MSTPEAIPRPKLSDQIQERLIEMIRAGGLAPGDILPSERELMARYRVGRPAIREAMQRLQHVGLVEIRHGERPRVARPSIASLVDQVGMSIRHLLDHSDASLDHLKEARTELEARMAGIAAARRADDDIRRLREIVDDQAAARADTERFLDLDAAFHRDIAAISGNPIFEVLTRGVFDWMRAFHVDFVRKPGLEDLTIAEHRVILEAIAAGDGPAAATAMKAHLERANALYSKGPAA